MWSSLTRKANRKQIMCYLSRAAFARLSVRWIRRRRVHRRRRFARSMGPGSRNTARRYSCWRRVGCTPLRAAEVSRRVVQNRPAHQSPTSRPLAAPLCDRRFRRVASLRPGVCAISAELVPHNPPEEAQRHRRSREAVWSPEWSRGPRRSGIPAALRDQSSTRSRRCPMPVAPRSTLRLAGGRWRAVHFRRLTGSGQTWSASRATSRDRVRDRGRVSDRGQSLLSTRLRITLEQLKHAGAFAHASQNAMPPI